jgi:hypothetical protein
MILFYKKMCPITILIFLKQHAYLPNATGTYSVFLTIHATVTSDE